MELLETMVNNMSNWKLLETVMNNMSNWKISLPKLASDFWMKIGKL